jgi:phosphoribosyl-ATP pyrophosphohydrolase
MVCILGQVILAELEDVLRSRRNADPEESYTARLLSDSELTQRKIMEEAFEVCLELARPETQSELAAQEAADLLYHLMVGLVSVDVSLDEVLAVLEERRS